MPAGVLVSFNAPALNDNDEVTFVANVRRERDPMRARDDGVAAFEQALQIEVETVTGLDENDRAAAQFAIGIHADGLHRVLFEQIAIILNGSPLHSAAPRGDRFADSATRGTRPSNRGNAVAATQLDPLLDRLSTDDAFREKILGNPVAGLAEYGFRVDPTEIPAVRRLPSKKDLVAQREKIKAGIVDNACLIFFAQAT